MGGSNGPGGILKEAVTTMFTGGASQIPGVKKAAQKTYDDITGKTSRNAMNDLQKNLANQQAASNDIQRQLLAAPKAVTPDNFFALKNKQLANLRLGLASTITSTNSLAPGGTGKTKLGS